MNNTTKENGKGKKIIIGVATIVAVAAIAVPTALTLTGNRDNAGASGNEDNRYNIIVSSGIDSVPDYSLSIEKGTTIEELKSLLKAIDGYTITGIYKDEAMQQPYADNEIITSDVKIYIEFTVLTHIVNIYAEDGTTLLDTQEVSHKDILTLTDPSKAEDDFATYEFKGWLNERNEQVNLNEITSDLNIHPYFETHMKDYRIGFTNSSNTESISVSVGGSPVDLNSTYHYGAKIVIRATQNVGRDITEFKVKVGNNEQQDILTEAYRHEENGVVYYEVELTGNGDLSITYNEAASEYSIGEIPEDIIVKRNGHTLSSNETIYYGDELEISYPEDYDVEIFEVSGANIVPGTENTYSVTGNINIIFEGTYKYAYLTFTECDGGYEVTGTNDNEVRDVVIPDTYKGKPVVSVKEMALMDMRKIISLKIGNNVSKVGRDAFGMADNLTTLIIGKSLTNIKYRGDMDWENPSFELSRMSKLSTVIIDKENPLFTSRDSFGNEINCVINKETKEIIKGTGNSIIPSDGSVISIGDSAFSECLSLTLIEISEEIKKIGECAFFGCWNLTSVNILSTSINMEGRIFGNCFGLTTVKISEGMTTIVDGMFEECNNLVSIVIPNSVKSIGERAFVNCSSLTSIIIPNNLTSIGNNAFAGCSNLTAISIPNSVTNIGDSAFSNCSSLTSITISQSVKSLGERVFANCSSLTSIEIPNSVISIGWCAFDGCSNLSTIVIPNSVTSIRADMFRDCNNLQYNIYDNAKYLGNEENPYLVLIEAVSKDITSCNINEDCKLIGYYAFKDCSNLGSITIPNSVIGIGGNVFEYCSSLTSIEIPNSVTSIGSSTFYECGSLTAIEIPSSVTSIEDYTFYGCYSLTTITIPDSVIRIGYYAFEYCNTLQFNVYDNAKYLGNEENPYLFLIEAVSKDITSCNINENCKFIADRAFYECVNLTTIKIPNSVTSIGESAFSGCGSLTSITIPSSVTIIEKWAFEYCSNLTTVIIESEEVYKLVTNGGVNYFGGLLLNAGTVRVLADVDDGSNSFLNENYSKALDGDYFVYTRK